MRTSKIERKTKETDISLLLNLDGSGSGIIDTGCGFLDHMLTLFSKHGCFDLSVTCKGDTYVDDHHTVEDVGIVLGQAFKDALGDKKGITRFGDAIVPMDEALIMTAADLSGRSFLGFGLKIDAEKVGTFDTELVEEFWNAFIRNAECTLHFNQISGKNSHHVIEGAFKSAARSFRKAVSIDLSFKDAIPSTKGVL